MPYYESVFIARQDVSAPQVETLADTFTEIISGGGGSVTKREYWGLRNLAYRIKKNRKGHYMLLNIDAPSEAVQEMERNMRISEDILRYMTIRVEELEEGDVDVAVKQKDDGQSVMANRENGIGALQGAGVIDTAAVEDPSGAIDAQAAMIGGHVLIRRGA